MGKDKRIIKAEIRVRYAGTSAWAWSAMPTIQPSKIVIVLKDTMHLMGEIDDLIPSWPIE